MGKEEQESVWDSIVTNTGIASKNLPTVPGPDSTRTSDLVVDQTRTASGSDIQTAAEAFRKSLQSELQLPLGQLIGYSELLQEDAQRFGYPHLVPDLEKITFAARRLAMLVDDLDKKVGVPRTSFEDESESLFTVNKSDFQHTPSPWIPPEIVSKPSSKSDPSLVPSQFVESSEEMMDILQEALKVTKKPQKRKGKGKKQKDQKSLREAIPVIPDSILVVDDSELSRNILARHLFRSGYAVCTAGGGREALETLQSHPFDLVLLDVVMPEIDGFTVLKYIRKLNSPAALPVIMVTGENKSEGIVEALEAGANDYITKPIDLPLIMARIKTQLGLKKARDRVKTLNDRLEQSQERLVRVVESAPDNQESVGVWARSLANEVATALSIGDLGVWLINRKNQLQLITGRSLKKPTPKEVDTIARTAKPLERSKDTLIPALGRAGELQGVVIVPKLNITNSQIQWRLLSSYARQLGGTLELKRLQDELNASERHRQASCKDLIERGIDILQVCPECGRCFDQTMSTCPIDGATLDSSRPLPYRIAKRYRLIKLLGEGGMGTVYHAFDHRLDREVAIKVINPDQFDNHRIQQRFAREARSIAKIDHPNIVAVYDYGNLESGSVYIVMERLHGKDLAQVMKEYGPGRPSEVAALIRQAGAALDAAHRSRLIHRDIKPENIFLIPDSEGFRVKLVDFGLVKEISADTVLTRTGTIIGTPLFMSPEQALAEPMDTRSDIYSLAAVVYYALTGRHVTLEKVLANVLIDIIKGKPPRISELLPNIPKTVDDAILSALSKDPENRPSDAMTWLQSFVRDLDSLDSDKQGWATDDGKLRMFTGPGKRKRSKK